MASKTSESEMVECSKCQGSGTYLHFGACFQCNGRGKHFPFKNSKPSAWWAKQCICFDASMSDMLCHIHSYQECIANRSQLANELRADAEYRAFAAKAN